MSESPLSKASIYLRVSSREQDPENQLNACRQFAESRGWSIVEVYRDQLSGFKDVERPEYNELMRDARNGLFNHIVVWSYDRWTRKGATALIKDIVKLTNWNVCLHSVQEEFLDSFNMKGELGDIIRKFLIGLLGWEAKLESKKRSERVKAAFHAGRGVEKWGRPRRKVSSEEAAQAYLETKSLRRAADKLGVKHTTISRRIREGFGLSNISLKAVREVFERIPSKKNSDL